MWKIKANLYFERRSFVAKKNDKFWPQMFKVTNVEQSRERDSVLIYFWNKIWRKFYFDQNSEPKWTIIYCHKIGLNLVRHDDDDVVEANATRKLLYITTVQKQKYKKTGNDTTTWLIKAFLNPFLMIFCPMSVARLVKELSGSKRGS